MSLSRRKFTKEFKEAPVRRLELGGSIAEVARTQEVEPSHTLRPNLWRGGHAAQGALKTTVGAQGSVQLCVLRLGFLQNREVRVGVFPEGEEIPIGGAGLGEGGRL
jgi:transposase-like protein